MAKSLRSKRKVSNRNKLRKTVFETVEKARNERLSAKLLQLASEPKPARDKDIDMESDSLQQEGAEEDRDEVKAEEDNGAMIVDKPKGEAPESPQSKKRSSRIQKKRKSKSIVFPVGRKNYKPKSQQQKRRS